MNARQKTAAKKRVLSLKAAQRAFAKLPKNEQRLAIARDVIDQVVLGRIEPRSTYLAFYPNEPHREGEDAGIVLAKEPEVCAACAIGSLFVCSVRLADEFSFKRFANMAGVGGNAARTSEVRRLAEWFNSGQLDLIENHFENRCGRNLGESCSREAQLVLIMRNIIENDGSFCPPVSTEIKRINAKARGMSLREVADLKKEI